MQQEWSYEADTIRAGNHIQLQGGGATRNCLYKVQGGYEETG